MIRVLAIESSATVCSVALCVDKQVVASREIDGGYHHAALLTTFIQEVFEEASLEPTSLNAVAVSKGPGSYTGLRIGVSAAKGICYASKVPLIGVSSLEAMAMTIAGEYSPNDVLISTLDAGRMEVYSMTWSGAMDLLEPLNARVIDAESFSHHSDDGRIILIGTGAAKLRPMFGQHQRMIFRDDIFPRAEWLIPPAIKALEAGRFEDVAYFEPLYLKEFVAGKPRIKGLV